MILRKEPAEYVGSDRHKSGSAPNFWHVVLIYPSILVALFCLLTVGGVSGSSVAILSDAARDPGLLFGSPQSVRSDEYDIHTPNFIGQINSGENGVRLLGVGRHDLSVLGNLPTKDWSAIFRPDTVTSLVLPRANALAWNWWFSPLICALAFYGIALLIGFGFGLSVSVSMLISFSPLVEWWHLYPITGPLGFGAAACFSILKALRSESQLKAFLWSSFSFYWIVAFALVLYPPFQIATLLAMIPITLAIIAADVSGSRYTWVRVTVSVGIVALAGAIVVGAFVMAHAEAISAIRGTVYPGSRQSTGGTGSLTQLLSANFSPVLAYGPTFFSGTNQSEIAAPYLLASESLVVLSFAGWRKTSATDRNVALTAACCLALGLAWHQLPIPTSIGRFFLLNLVPPQRVLPLIAISGPFLLGVLIHSQTRRLSKRRKSVMGVAVGSTTFSLALIEALRIKDLLPPFPLAALLAMAILGAVAMAIVTAAPSVWATTAVVALVGIGFLSVNPLYRGISPLEHADIAQAIHHAGTDAIWVNYADPSLEGFLAASGASSLSGPNYYPNSDGWKTLLGGFRDESVWNRYLQTRWLDGSTRAELRLVTDHWAEVHISPCAPPLTSLGVTHVLAAAGTFSASDTCLHLIDGAFWHGRSYVIYARFSSNQKPEYQATPTMRRLQSTQLSHSL